MSSEMTTPQRRSTDNPLKHQHRVKRMMFVASLYFRLTGVRNPTRTQLSEVNRRFKLAHGHGALLFPAALSCMIWKKANLTDLLNRYKAGEGVNKLVSDVLTQAPSWVRYGDGATAHNDIQAVFECCTQ